MENAMAIKTRNSLIANKEEVQHFVDEYSGAAVYGRKSFQIGVLPEFLA